jgi:integrase
MATFRKRGDKWQARIQRRGQPDISKTFLDKRDAERWARAIERELDLGRYVCRNEVERATLGDLLRRYREEVTPTKRGSGPEIEAIRIKAMERDKLAAVVLSALTAKHIADYRDRRLASVTPSTLLRDLQTLSACLNHARREWGMPIANPVADVRRPSPNKARARLLEPEEEARLLDALTRGGRDAQGRFHAGTRNPWIAPLVRLALETAMRRGELLALRWEHVNLTKATAHLPTSKNGDARTVPLSPVAVKVLQGMPRDISGRVFPTTALAVRKAFERAREAAGLEDLHFHDLRHCAATRLAETVSNLIELASITGHRDLKMLARYYHPKAEDLAAKLAGQG